MKISRRNFIKTTAWLGASTALTATAIVDLDRDADERKRPYYKWRTDYEAEWGMLIDLDKCDGCTDKDVPLCTQACITGHFTPDDHEYIKVFEIQSNEASGTQFFPRPCQQCQDPPCVHVCPVGAAWQRDGDRLTLIDHSRCIGCRLCMAACPYEVRFFHWEDNPKAKDPDLKADFNEKKADQMPFSLVRDKGVTAKCEFCGNQFKGELPHCVSACDEGALYFGNLKENSVTNSREETIDVAKTIENRYGFRWKEEENTKPRVFYLPVSEGGEIHGEDGH